jgi:mannose-6-phosphate isomerase-like protein (cupin superfamily)
VRRRNHVPAFLAVAGALLLAGVVAGEHPTTHPGHVAKAADALEWGPAPPGLPPGAKVALLAGNPAADGPYTLRAWMPDGYVVPPHWHPSTEHLTILSGTLWAGAGETMDTASAQAVGAGGFVVMPARMTHWVRTEGETLIQVHGTGPFEITYLDRANDPRQPGAK